MGGLFGEEREDDELKVLRAELAPGTEAVPADVAVPKDATQNAGEALPSAMASGAPAPQNPAKC